MGKSSPPPAPNYTAAAEATGASSKEVAANQNYANRPNQQTPWGSTTWTQSQKFDPGSNSTVTTWNQNDQLNPMLQGALNTEVEQQRYRSGLARDLMGRIGAGYDSEPSFDQFGDPAALRQQSQDSAYSALKSRLDPEWDQRENDMTINLRNQGLRPGSEAYDRAYGNMSRGRNDAYSQAQAQAQAEGRAETGLGAQLRQQQIAEYLQERGVPLNEVNAIMTGQQVAQPNMPSFTGASRAAPVDYMGAAGAEHQGNLDAYNAKQAGSQGFMSGLFSLGSAALMCDRRLKTDIVRIGTIMGYPLYRFKYLWGELGIGPMSDEVNPEAVLSIGGYDMVDLSQLR